MEERGQQILGMREIYATASKVLVWLGDYGPETSQAFDLIRFIATDRPFNYQDRRKLDTVYAGLTNDLSCQEFQGG